VADQGLVEEGGTERFSCRSRMEAYLMPRTTKAGQTRFAENGVMLKGQCHEIFDPRFFRQSIIPRPQINNLKYFRIMFRIHRYIRP
jgi:hypothetical protein